MFAEGHVPGTINLPHSRIVRSKLERWPAETLFVTYCAGPHCNVAARVALRLAELGCLVKIMVGGITGWIEARLELAKVSALELWNREPPLGHTSGLHFMIQEHAV